MKIILNLGLFVFCSAIPIFVGGQDPKPGEDIKKAIKSVDLLANENFAKAVALFDETMKSASPFDQLRELWQVVGAQIRSIKKRIGARNEKATGFKIVYVNCEFEKPTIDLKLVFDGNGRIAGMFIVPTETPVKFTIPGYARTEIFLLKKM